MKKTNIDLIPHIVDPSPDYYCTWQTQLYATNDGKPAGQRAIIGEKALFGREKPFGWAYFHEKARRDLLLIMDDSWDVPLNNDSTFYGSLILNAEKFPTYTTGRTNTEALKALVDTMKSLGWKGLGGWVCAQESPLEDAAPEEYWKKRVIESGESGFAYWKVDWGAKGTDFAFRKMLTDLGRKYAPSLVIEHAMLKEIIPHSDVFRTYDVPAIMSIPMTMQKLAEFTCVPAPADGSMGLINCEDEAYIAAAGGFIMGIMRHPYSGDFMNGNADMSFPAVHRDLKTKMYEVIRAARWHRIAPAFAADETKTHVAKEILTDTWRFENQSEEIEAWWFGHSPIKDHVVNGVLTKTGPAAVARNTELPDITPDENGYIPFCVAAKNPDGAFSVVTAGRTVDRTYFIPRCDVTVKTGDAKTVGVFGEYRNLFLKTELCAVSRVLMQDLADETAFDVTDQVIIKGKEITVPGELISKIGTMAQPKEDTSEPGVVIRFV